MKQVIVKKGTAVVEEVPIPMVHDGMVLVQNMYSTISVGTEMSSITNTGKTLWKRALENPSEVKKAVKIFSDQGYKKTSQLIKGRLDGGNAVGYSSAGVVREVGDGVTGFEVGDYVACAGAGYALHAEYITAPSNLILPLEQKSDLAHASTVALGAIALQGVRRANVTLGETFVVIGLGVIGQLAAQLLNNNGCTVIGIDVNNERGKLAIASGLDYFIQAEEGDVISEVMKITHGIGADGVIITAASTSDVIVSQSFLMCRKKGRVVLVGSVGLALNRGDFYKKEIDLLISTSYGPGRYDTNYEEAGLDYPIAYVRWTEKRNMELFLKLVQSGRVDLKPLIHKIYKINDASEAYSDLSGELKPLIVILEYPTQKKKLNDLRVLQEVNNGDILKKKAHEGTIQVGLIGAGGFAKGVHIPHLVTMKDYFSLRTIIDRKGQNAKSTAVQFGASHAGTNPQDIFNDKKVNAVIITTRHNSHGKLALDALKSGKHVLVEKPMVVTHEELNAIETFYKQSKGKTPILLTGFNRRFSPHIRAIKKIVLDRKAPMVISYRMNAGYKSLDNWVHNVEGGGRNIGEACHIYDLFTYLTDAEVKDVQTSCIDPGQSYYSPRDNFIATLTFADGSIASLIYTALGNATNSKEIMDIYFDGKIIHLDDYKETKYYGVKQNNRRSKRSEKGHLEELTAFGESINNADKWPIPFWQQVQAMKIALEVERNLI
jgi:predicted dehydrogenase/threonine dehydrogenase-like Zn-dependent dehydrogenase